MITRRILFAILVINILTLEVRDEINVNTELGLLSKTDKDPTIFFIEDNKWIEWSIFFRNPTTIFKPKDIITTARCSLKSNANEKFLHPFLDQLNNTWAEEIDGLSSLLPNNSSKHKRSILLGLGILASILVGYLIKTGISHFQNIEHTTDKESIIKLSDRTIRMGTYITRSRQHLASMGNSLCFFSQHYDAWLRELEVKNHLSRYVTQLEEVTLDFAAGKLPPNRKIVEDLKKSCMKFQLVNNKLADRFCTYVIGSRPEIIFMGYVVDNEGTLQLDIKVKMPIVSPEMMNLNFSIIETDNIGFYINNDKVKISVPKYSILFNDSNQLAEVDLIRCKQQICPVSSIKNSPSSMCLEDVIKKVRQSKHCISTIVFDEFCETILVPGLGTLISVRNGQYITTGINIQTKTLVNSNQIVGKGRLICTTPFTNFSLSVDGKDKNIHQNANYNIEPMLDWEFEKIQSYYKKLNNTINDIKTDEFKILDVPIKHDTHFALTFISILINFFVLIFVIYKHRSKLLESSHKLKALFTKTVVVSNEQITENVNVQSTNQANVYPTVPTNENRSIQCRLIDN